MICVGSHDQRWNIKKGRRDPSQDKHTKCHKAENNVSNFSPFTLPLTSIAVRPIVIVLRGPERRVRRIVTIAPATPALAIILHEANGCGSLPLCYEAKVNRNMRK